MQLCKGKKANDIWVFVLNFSTIVPPDGRQTLHPYQLVLKSMCLSYFFLQCMCILFNSIPVTLIEKKICKTIFHVPRIHQKSWDPLCSVLLSHHFSLRKNRYISSIYCCQRSWKNHLPKGVMDDIGQGITSGIKSLGYRKSICFVSEFKSRTALKGSQIE